MTPEAVLVEVKIAARTGAVFPRTHALERQSQRNATARDVRSAMLSATKAVAQFEKTEHRWRLEGGVDLNDCELHVVVVLEQNRVVVVTVF